jgi:hypothetical protein
MGSPISSVLAKIFLQHLENKFYPEMIRKTHIQYIARYADDILIIYDSNKTTAQDILIARNNMYPSIKYNLEVEHEGIINFLDLKICRRSDEILIGIYRKPTFTDVMIPAQSIHPMQNNISGFKYMLDRANTLSMSKEHNKEICIIKTIAENNGYNMETLMKAYGKHKNRSNNTQDSRNYDRKIGTRFTYFRDEIRTLTTIFKNSPVRIGYCPNNIIKTIA